MFDPPTTSPCLPWPFIALILSQYLFFLILGKESSGFNFIHSGKKKEMLQKVKENWTENGILMVAFLSWE